MTTPRRLGGIIRLAGLTKRLADLSVVTSLRDLFDVHAPEQIPDPWSPKLHDSGWELQVGVAFGMLLLIGVMIALR